jgi:hypothetical protein
LLLFDRAAFSNQIPTQPTKVSTTPNRIHRLGTALCVTIKPTLFLWIMMTRMIATLSIELWFVMSLLSYVAMLGVEAAQTPGAVATGRTLGGRAGPDHRVRVPR